MECTSEKCKKNLRKRLQIIHGSINVSSESSLSSNSEAHFHHFQSLSRRRKKASCHSKYDYLSRLFERKKLKDKSLSKKLRTPFDRKINRTCWPIELSKVSKIKKKPREKRREKPTHRSLTRRDNSDSLILLNCRENSPQVTCSGSETCDDDYADDDDDDDDDDSLNSQLNFSNPMFISCYTKRPPQIFCTGYSMKASNPDFLSRVRARSPAIRCSHLKFISDDTYGFRSKFSKLKFFSQCRASSSHISCCELELFNEDSFNIVYQYVKNKCSLHKYDQVTPGMLLEVLRDPEYLETGATIDTIVQEIRLQNKNLNPEVHLLIEEVAIKLLWTIALGLIVEEHGYYKIVESFQKENENINLIWDWWYRRMKNIRK